MAAFRRCVIALAVLAIFAGLASAQNVPMTCNVNATPAQGRSEGQTELIGDLVVTCTGGAIPTSGTGSLGSAAFAANWVVTLPATVTSRLTQATGNVSDALMVIDDPQSTGAFSGYGTGATPIVCLQANSAAGCATFVNQSATIPPVATNQATFAGSTNAPNVYQGVISGTQITFFGVPVVPPASTGVSRTFRITNVRVNMNGLSGPQSASIALSGNGANQLQLNASSATVAVVTSGMTVSVAAPSAGTSLAQCTAGSFVPASSGTGGQNGVILNFAENIGGGFRTRVIAGAAQNSAQSNAAVQNLPGTSYGTESGLTFNIATGTGTGVNTVTTSGLADFGTRLKATFSNIPSGVRVFVSFNNTSANGLVSQNVPAASQGSTGALNANQTLFAQMLGTAQGEAVSDGTSFSSVAATPTVPTSAVLAPFGFPYVEITPASGSTAVAVWEVLNTSTTANETASFPVWFTYAAGGPPVGSTITVNLSYAPTTAAGAAAVPRFVDPLASSPKNVVTFTQCQTTLLYPYVQSTSLFETGLAISNTTTDPFGTATQAGSCTLNFYGSGAPTPSSVTIPKTGDPYLTSYPSATAILTGTTWANITSAYAPGFSGYMIAVCNFQLAHGFAFIAYNGNTNEAMGYLPLVLSSGTGKRVTETPGNGYPH